ncbi:hypothetical protein MOQ72_29140 [Saccharopolyspora sp. K220]|uniref:hypothetical protein n=1 Tax=Saccharopolyspora soli TaxID=2926618 RepID=UPI001F594649|nr:hypothetical protein [Saccharopolyspora soli]MCI2421507.1 hypothetical protein [Saccharopolyspora soli]
MSIGTTLPTVKRALVDALSARPGLAGVQVVYELPQRGLLTEAIWFGEDTETENTIPVMRAGTKKVDETYALPLVVQVLITDGRDAETADQRAATLLGQVQQCLAENPRLTPEIQWAELGGWSHRVGPIGDGSSRGSRFDALVRVQARLFP